VHRLRLVALGAALLGPASVTAQETLRLTPGIRVQETATNNANLGSGSARKADLITEVSPYLGLRWNGRRVQLNGSVAATGVYYLNDSQPERLIPRVNLLGNVEAIERFFFVEGAVATSRQYNDVFGPRSISDAVGSGNQTTFTTYRLSPYISGRAYGDINYLLRNDLIYTTAGQGQGGLANATQTNWTGVLSQAPTPAGWELSYNRNETEFRGQSGPPLVTETARARGIYQVDPQLQVFAIGGYEWNQIFLDERNGTIVGGGFVYRPGPRTTINATYEKRYFGPSHNISIDHRNPSVVINVTSSRGISTFPQLAAGLVPGLDLRASLDAAFTTRIPDPVARARAVDEFLLPPGPPATLTGVVNFYTQSVFLRTYHAATVTLLGRRNSVATTVFYQKNESLASAPGGVVPLTTALAAQTIQDGVSTTYSNRLTANASLNVTGAVTRVRGLAPVQGQTRLYAARVTLNQQLSPFTTGFVGGRVQRFDTVSGAGSDFSEVAAFVGVDHRF
jgi:uncharacterized protein (PEP-CTERM system associated)